MKYAPLIFAWLTCGAIVCVRRLIVGEWPEPEGILLGMVVTLFIAIKIQTEPARDNADNDKK